MTTPEKTQIQQEVLAAFFNAQKEYEKYWDSNGIENDPADKPLEMGSLDHFYTAVSLFCKRFLPQDMPSSKIDEYEDAICGMESDVEDEWEPLAIVCADMHMEEFLLHAFSIHFKAVPYTWEDLVSHAGPAKVHISPRGFEAVAEVYLQDDTVDRSAFWQLVMTQGMAFYNQIVKESVDTQDGKDPHAAQKFLIEQLLKDGHRPFEPEEYQAYIEKFLMRRIKSDEERLNPWTYGTPVELEPSTD